MSPATTGHTARTQAGQRGLFRRNRWLILRRTSQLSILGLFLLGPLAGIWIFKGTLAGSKLLATVPLADPFILLQSLAAGHRPTATLVIGALLIGVFYLLVGGRTYCSWVCPMNLITDLAAWLRSRLGLEQGSNFNPASRYWLLAASLLVSAISGTIVWELINPVTMLHRGLLFGIGLAWLIPAGVFFLDLLVARRAWCGHLCPVGAAYGLLGLASPLRVLALGRDRCSNCGDCFRVCPEPQVINPALKTDTDVAPHTFTIVSPNCTNCGRCIDVCPEQVFSFGNRYKQQSNQENL